MLEARVPGALEISLANRRKPSDPNSGYNDEGPGADGPCEVPDLQDDDEKAPSRPEAQKHLVDRCYRSASDAKNKRTQPA